MRYCKLLFIFIFGIAVCCGCEDDSESEIILLLKPDELVKTAKAGEKVLYTVEAFSNDGNLRQLKLTTYDSDNGLKTVMDTLLGNSRVRFDYQYTVPQFADTTDVKLQFEVFNEFGYSASLIRFVKVMGGEVILRELTGITMYSGTSGRPDAYNIALEQLQNSHTVEGDSLMDLYAWQDPEGDETVLSREWRSHSGLKFMRFNDFNYSTATQLSVENAYRAGVKLNYIRDLKADDVVLVGNDAQALGIIKIVYVFDDPGMQDDRYIFNLKKIVR